MTDELEEIARERESRVARPALACVQAPPTASPTIMDARSVAQLEDNRLTLEVKLTPTPVAALDGLTRPKFSFP